MQIWIEEQRDFHRINIIQIRDYEQECMRLEKRIESRRERGQMSALVVSVAGLRCNVEKSGRGRPTKRVLSF